MTDEAEHDDEQGEDYTAPQQELPDEPPVDHTSAKRIAKAERIKHMMDLRLQGYSLEEIGAAQDPPIKKQSVSKIIKDALAKVEIEPAEDVVKLELSRLDQMLGKHYERALNGDGWATDRVLAIMDRRARYLGLDSPIKTSEVGELAEAKTSLLNKLNKIASASLPRDAAPVMIDATAVEIVGTSDVNAGDEDGDDNAAVQSQGVW